MKNTQKQRKIFAVLLAAALILTGLFPLPAAAAEDGEAAVSGAELAGLLGAPTLREMLDQRLTRLLAGGTVQAGETDEENGEDLPAEDGQTEKVPSDGGTQSVEPRQAQEKTPPAGAPTATDILASTQVIAHGLGEVGGTATLNCLEGFLENYAKGVRVFEADLRLTADGKVVLRHDWRGGWQEGVSEADIPTREAFLSKPILERYTPLSFQDLLLLLDEYPDVAVITDSKFTDTDVAAAQFGMMVADARELGLSYVFDRIIVQFYNQNMQKALDSAYGFPHYIYTLYNEGFSGTEDAFRTLAGYCASHGVEGITMWDYWWKPAFAPIAQEYGVRVYVHTVNDLEAAQGLLASGVSAVYTDSLTDAALRGGM